MVESTVRCVARMHGEVEILKNQLTTKFTLLNDYGADFWEFLTCYTIARFLAPIRQRLLPPPPSPFPSFPPTGVYLSRACVSLVSFSLFIHLALSLHFTPFFIVVVLQLDEWVMSNIYKWVTSHIWASHVTHMKPLHFAPFFIVIVRKLMNATCQTYMNESRHTYALVMSHIWMSRVTHMNESCHTYEWVTLHIWISHITYTNESCHTYEWVMSHIWITHVNPTTEPCHIYELVMSHVWMSHVTCMNESWHTCEWLMCDTRRCVWHDSFICGPWLMHMCDRTHSYVWHDSCICVTGLIHMYDMTHSCVWHDSFICAAWTSRTHTQSHIHTHTHTHTHTHLRVAVAGRWGSVLDRARSM